MEVHILIPPDGKTGIEIRILGMEKGQDVKVIEKAQISNITVKDETEYKNPVIPEHKPRWDNEDSTVCRNCGKALFPATTGRKKRFCCDQCRRKWWKENRDKIRMGENSKYSFICKNCGKAFVAYGNAYRQYCSHECYISARFYDGKRLNQNTDGTDCSEPPTVSLI